MNLRFLETFVWVARLHSFTLAAQRVHATQAAVSERIASLERDLGVRLFERGKRDVVLTENGKLALAEAEIILQRYQRLKIRLVSGEGRTGSVRLSVSGTIVHSFLPDILQRIQEEYPRVNIDLITAGSTVKAISSLLDNHIDLALLMGPVEHENVVNFDLCHFATRWISSPELITAETPLDVMDLARFPILSFSADSIPHQFVKDIFKNCSADTTQIYPSQSLALSIRLAMNGRGVALLPPATVARELADGSLRIIPVQQEPLSLRFTATTLRSDMQSLGIRFAELASIVAADYCSKNDPGFTWL